MSARAARFLSAAFSGETLFALFLLAGYFKADPRLAFLQSRFDLTLVLLLLSVLSAVRRLVLHQPVRLAAGLAAGAAVLLMAWVAVGSLYSPDLPGAWDKALRFVFVTGWAFWGSILIVRGQLSLRRFAWALVLFALAMATDSAVGSSWFQERGFESAFGSNYLALGRAAGLGLLSAVCFLVPSARTRWRGALLLGASSLLLVALLSAGGRGPVLALVLGLLVFVLTGFRLWPTPRVQRYAARLLAVMTLGGLLLVFFSLEGHFETLVARLRMLGEGGGASALQRVEYWRSALAMWSQSPIYGVGTGGFGLVRLGASVRDYPHNIILELGAENGWIGVTIFLLLLHASVGRCVARLRVTSGEERRVARFLVAVAIFTLANAMVSGDLNDNRMLFTALALCAVTRRFIPAGQVDRGSTLRMEANRPV